MRMVVAAVLALAGWCGAAVAQQSGGADSCVRNPHDWSARPCTREVELAQRLILADAAVLAPACRLRPQRWGQDLRGMLAGSTGLTAVPGPRPTARQARDEAAAVQRALARAEAILRTNRRAACAEIDPDALPRGDAMVQELRDFDRNCPDWSCVRPIE